VNRSYTTRSESETTAVGRDLGVTLDKESVVLLYGDLGAGKTAFVRGLAEGLSVSPAEVTSPTFTLIQEYRGGRLPLLHVDLYRLDDRREVDDLGLDELGTGAVLAIEWAEKLPGGGWQDAISVRITTGEGDTRRIEITPYSDR
jgi:tRNA threonylcarbamoyladenosine biosynthesis protein TsaE